VFSGLLELVEIASQDAGEGEAFVVAVQAVDLTMGG
jgi:hypothetical protein